ncbi:MAG: hybrid sensor histidine kinase/response regulator, partial [Alphaproteobacteria bacterium]
MSEALAFLAGGGEAARMIREQDWSDHPLGPPETWSEGFRTALSLILNSPESMILTWGPDLHFFFNDTYFPLLGPRLDWAMGERFDVVWADAWEQAKPIIDDALAGRSQRFDDLPW